MTAVSDEEVLQEVEIAKSPRLTRNILQFIKNFDSTLKNPDKIDAKTYDKMYETDESIQAGIEFICLSAISMLGEYTHPKPKIQKSVRQAIINLKEGWVQFLEELIADGYVFGFGLAEIELKVEPKKTKDQSELSLKTSLHNLIGINPQSGRHQVDLDRNSPTYGDIQGFIQWPGTSYHKFIPAEKLVYWSRKSRHQNPYGRSALKSIWKDWVIKDQMLKAWALSMERYGTPLTWIKTDSSKIGMKVKLDDGSEMDRVEYLLSILEDLQNTTGFVIEEGEEVNTAQVPRSVGNDFKCIVDHMNAMMYRGLLIPVLLFDTAEIGSNALARQHFQVYIMSMARLMNQLIPIIIRKVIRLFIVANFGIGIKDYGTFAIKELTEENLKLFSDVFYAMTQEGYLSPKLKQDMDMIRSKLGFTAVSDEDHEKLVDWIEESEAPLPVAGVNPEEPNNPSRPVAPDKPAKKIGGRKNNPGGPQPEKPGTRDRVKAPSKKQGRPGGR